MLNSGNSQYIKSLYEAAKIYLQSRGIAWFNLEALTRIVKFLVQTRTYVYSTQIDEAQVLKGLKFTKTGREAGYLLKFLWYIGFLSCKYQNNKFYYKLNSSGWQYYKLLETSPHKAFLHLYTNIVEKWEPLLKLIEYLSQRKSATPDQIVEDLGGDMMYWTKIMTNFGFKVKQTGVRKPYNNFVTRALLIPLAEELGLIEKTDNKIKLTQQAKELPYLKKKEYDVIRTRPKDPLIYAAVCNILLEEEATVITPWIDHTTAQNLTKGIIAGLNKYTKLKHLKIITREPKRKDMKKAVETLLSLKDYIEVEARTAQHRPLHAKTTIGTNTAIITSANLIHTSLWRNFELGILFHQTPPQLKQLTEEEWNLAQPYINIRS